MTLTDFPLATGLKRIVDGLIRSVADGVRGFRAGGAHANHPPGLSLAILNRLVRVLRFAFLMVATQLELEPARARAKKTATKTYVRTLRRPAFPLFPKRRGLVFLDAPRVIPPHLSKQAERDPYRAIFRKREALMRALADPATYIRRMARRLPTQLKVIGWFPPKRPPPCDRRDYWDDLIEGWREAVFQLNEYRRRRRDSAGLATSAP